MNSVPACVRAHVCACMLTCMHAFPACGSDGVYNELNCSWEQCCQHYSSTTTQVLLNWSLLFPNAKTHRKDSTIRLGNTIERNLVLKKTQFIHKTISSSLRISSMVQNGIISKCWSSQSYFTELWLIILSNFLPCAGIPRCWYQNNVRIWPLYQVFPTHRDITT